MSGRTAQQGPVEPAVPRHGRMPRHGAWRTCAKIAASVVAVLAVSATAIVAYAAVDLVASVKPTLQVESEKVLEGVPDIGAMEGGLNFLLVGSDKRPESGAFGDPEEESAELNDVTMLLHISQDHSHVEVVSFPRDMLVEVPECPDPEDPEGEPLSGMSEVKINTVLAHGGFGCVAATVERLTGVTIPVGGIVQFDGVAALADGGRGRGGLPGRAGRRRLLGAAPRCRHPQHHGLRGARLPPHSPRRRRRQRPRPHLEPADVPRVAHAHDAERRRPRRSAEALLDRQGDHSRTCSSRRHCRTPSSWFRSRQALQAIDLSKIAFIQYPTGYTDGFAAVVPTESSAVVNAALQADVPVSLDPAATTDSDFGTVPDPAAPPAEPPPAEDGRRRPIRPLRPRRRRPRSPATSPARPRPTCAARAPTRADRLSTLSGCAERLVGMRFG